jgi:hypothetical protein
MCNKSSLDVKNKYTKLIDKTVYVHANLGYSITEIIGKLLDFDDECLFIQSQDNEKRFDHYVYIRNITHITFRN